MATTQAFDADTLEAALARVTEECGPNARITQAEKVRTGGIAGFFARERFEVTVELDDDVPTDRVPAADDRAVDAQPLSLLDLVEQASEEERIVAPAPAVAGDRAAQDDAARPAATVPSPSTEGPTFQEVLRGIASQAGLLGATSSATAATATAVEPPPASEPVLAPGGPRVPAAAGGPSLEADHAMFASLGVPQHLLHRPGTSGSVARRLLAVLEGVPAAPPVIARRGEVVAVIGDGSAAVDAAAVLARQLGQGADDVIVAAPGQQGLNALSDPTDAEARASMWRSCGAPLVVAICAPPGRAGASWAKDMRDALAPVTVWGAVRADRKPEDIAAAVAAVGGADALAVTGCDSTATPAAVLAAGIPVAALEGRRASAAAWTALLVERLTV